MKSGTWVWLLGACMLAWPASACDDGGGAGEDAPGDHAPGDTGDPADIPPLDGPDLPDDGLPDTPLDSTEEPPPAGDTLYVDRQIGTESCDTYDEDARACGSGSAAAFQDLGAASAAAEPGDLVLVREAVFSEPFAPARSGEPSAPITFRSYPGETVTITLDEGPFLPGIELTNRSYLVLDGINVDGAMMWAQVLDSSHNVFTNSRFSAARDYGSRGGFRLISSDYNKILGCTFEDGNDNLFLENSSYNLIEGNTLRLARHTLLVLACSNYNVVRNNVLHNETQKGGETFDCEGVIESLYDDTLQVRRMDATKHNIWEANRFTYTAPSSDAWDYNAIQFAGQEGIVRFNLFYDNLGGGLGIQVYSDEALHNYGNRIYHNTMTANHCFGIWASGDTEPTYHDNVIMNNIAYANLDCDAAGPADIEVDNLTANRLEGNRTDDPLFADHGGRDLHLGDGSPMIDAGVFLTRTAGSGSGTELQVEDAGYFYDGYGIDGETGDSVQLEGQTDTALVLEVDYENDILTLDRPLTWTANQGLAIAYSGAAPDVGALEHP